jgi:hypothetical protein
MNLLRLLAVVVRYLWALPTSALGMVVLVLTLVTGGRARWHSGVLEVHGGFATLLLRRLVPLKGGASAMTLGHVVIARDEDCLEWTRAHERVHVRQCERWGPLFVPAYFCGAVYAKIRGGRAYMDNPFEREAYERG